MPGAALDRGQHQFSFDNVTEEMDDDQMEFLDDWSIKYKSTAKQLTALNKHVGYTILTLLCSAVTLLWYCT